MKSEYEYEIILVNDASPDNVLDEIKAIALADPRIKAIKFDYAATATKVGEKIFKDDKDARDDFESAQRSR